MAIWLAVWKWKSEKDVAEKYGNLPLAWSVKGGNGDSHRRGGWDQREKPRKSGLRIFVRASEVPFFCTRIWPLLTKVPIFKRPKMALRMPEQKFWDHFYKSNIPQKWWNRLSFQAFTTFGRVFGQFLNSVLFWPFYSLKIPTFVKIYVYVNEASESENKNSFEISEQNGTTCRYAQVKKRKKSE